MKINNDLIKIRKTMGLIFEETTEEFKIIFYIYFCDKDDPRYEEFIDRYHNLDMDLWVESSSAHHRGFSKQGILNTDNLEDAIDFARVIYDTFDENPLIVLSKQKVKNITPVGQNTQKLFIRLGEIFDELVENKSKGIYII